jgi:phosphoglycolate phosphatase
LAAYVGPSLAHAFQSILQTDDPVLIERAVVSYRRRFEQVGMFENAVYPGIPEVLAALVSDGHRLSVVTAKPATYATAIVQHFAIAQYLPGCVWA